MPKSVRFSRAAVIARFPHYFALRAAAKALGLPIAYKRDLTFWDRVALGKRAPALPFVVAVRENGTHLVTPEYVAHGTLDGKRGAHGAHAMVTWIEDAFAGYRCHWFAWDGNALRAVTAPQARAFLKRHAPRELSRVA